MTGTEKYEDNFNQKAIKLMAKHPDTPLLEDFYNYMLIKHTYPTSYNYAYYVASFMDYVGVTDPAKLTLNHYTRYMSSIKEKSSTYKIAVYSALKKFSAFLEANELNKDHMKFIDRPNAKESQKTKDRREAGYMTKKEIDRYIKAIKWGPRNDIWKQRDVAIVLLFLNTGIRCAALYKLDVSDIDFENSTISVLEKGENVRKIHVSDFVMEELERWIDIRNSFYKGNDDALFVSCRHQRFTQIGIYEMVSKTYGYCINKAISPHKFRATYGTIMYDKTKDIYFVQQAMGHSSPTVTQLYIRGGKNEMSKKASDIMNDVLSDLG